jgi:hypothetical protein
MRYNKKTKLFSYGPGTTIHAIKKVYFDLMRESFTVRDLIIDKRRNVNSRKFFKEDIWILEKLYYVHLQAEEEGKEEPESIRNYYKWFHIPDFILRNQWRNRNHGILRYNGLMEHYDLRRKILNRKINDPNISDEEKNTLIDMRNNEFYFLKDKRVIELEEFKSREEKKKQGAQARFSGSSPNDIIADKMQKRIDTSGYARITKEGIRLLEKVNRTEKVLPLYTYVMGDRVLKFSDTKVSLNDCLMSHFDSVDTHTILLADKMSLDFDYFLNFNYDPDDDSGDEFIMDEGTANDFDDEGVEGELDDYLK